MLSLKRFVAVGASEEAILFSKLWLDANYFKQTRRNLRLLVQRCCASLPLTLSSCSHLACSGSMVFTEIRLMFEISDFANWGRSVKEKLSIVFVSNL